MLQLTNKLHLLTQLSQEEIQQTFHVTIQELQSILDQSAITSNQNVNINVNINDDDHDDDTKKNTNITDQEMDHLLSPKIYPKPHMMLMLLKLKINWHLILRDIKKDKLIWIIIVNMDIITDMDMDIVIVMDIVFL